MKTGLVLGTLLRLGTFGRRVEMRRSRWFLLALVCAVLPLRAIANTCTVTSPTVLLSSCGCVGDGAADDTACWQAALDAAIANGNFGTVEATQGKIYKIINTLTVTNTNGGVINGNGATLDWAGSNSPNLPMWLLTDTQKLRIENLTVFSRPTGQSYAGPLDTAFEFTHGDWDCTNPGTHVAPSANVLDHVTIQGTNDGGLNFGVRFSNRSSRDCNNDLSVISDTAIYNVTVAAVSIEHSQSKYHVLRDVAAVSAPHAPCSSFVSLHAPRTTGDTCRPIYTGSGSQGSGSFAMYGSSGGGFTSGDFELTAASDDNILIMHHNSEGSNCMIRAEGVTGGGEVVQVIGGRFAVNGLSSFDSGHCVGQTCDSPDESWIRYNRPGPLVIDGIVVDGDPPSGIAPKIHFYPPANSPYIGETVDVRNVQFAYPNSVATDPIDVGSAPNARVNASGNLCTGPSPNYGDRTCTGYAAGVSGWTGVAYAKLDARLDGHQTYCTDCGADPASGACTGSGGGAFARRVGGTWKCTGAELTLAGTQTISNKTLDGTNTFPSTLATLTGSQTLSNKNLSDGTNTFPGSLATLSDSQILTNKDLTSTTNAFPLTSMLSFTTGSSVTTSRYCAVGNAIACNTSTESAVSIGVGAGTAKGLWCKASAAPNGANKNWTFKVVKNGTGTSFACNAISNTGTTCSDTSTSLNFSSGDTMSLQFVATTGGNAPASATVFCLLGFSPVQPPPQ